MATNKRKDAAALFELIDKSTLKVPKSASGLKIPNWWTSKTNPQTASDPVKAAPAPVPSDGLSKLRAVPSEKAGTSPVAPASTDASSQSRLFKPSPAASGPGASPSIRPPGASIRPPVSPTVKAPPPAALKPATPGAVESQVPAPAVMTPPSLLPPTAPRTPWSPPRPGAFARVPTWVLVSSISGLILVVCLIVLLLQNRNRSVASQDTSPSPSAENVQDTGSPTQKPAHRQSLIPSMNDTPSAGRQTASASAGSAVGATPASPAQPLASAGRFTGPGTVDRNTDAMVKRLGHAQYYIFIASSPSEDVARRNGEFLAAHGFDVSVETEIIEKKKWFVLVTDDGFPSYDAAEPFRKKIVQAGHELPQYKKSRDGRQAYDSARITNNVKTVAQNTSKG